MQGHGGGGKFDYKIKEGDEGERYTFNVNGKIYNGPQFGNFVAGYAGVWFGPGGYQGVRAGGVVYDYIDGQSNWDLDSVDDINAGAEMATREMRTKIFDSCGCKDFK